MKITLVTKENPRRPNTTQHARYATLARLCAKGCTVAQYREGNGDILALRYAWAQGHVKLA